MWNDKILHFKCFKIFIALMRMYIPSDTSYFREMYKIVFKKVKMYYKLICYIYFATLFQIRLFYQITNNEKNSLFVIVYKLSESVSIRFCWLQYCGQNWKDGGRSNMSGETWTIWHYIMSKEGRKISYFNTDPLFTISIAERKKIWWWW